MVNTEGPVPWSGIGELIKREKSQTHAFMTLFPIAMMKCIPQPVIQNIVRHFVTNITPKNCLKFSKNYINFHCFHDTRLLSSLYYSLDIQSKWILNADRCLLTAQT